MVKNHYQPLLVGGKTVSNQTRVTTNDLYFTNGTGASFATNGACEYSVFDGTVYRLREISLGYTLPATIVSKLRLSAITISLSGRNLWYLAPNLPKYIHFDPDINSVMVVLHKVLKLVVPQVQKDTELTLTLLSNNHT